MNERISFLLKIFDIFGVKFSFNYKTYETYRTSLGGIMFIIYCFLGVFFVLYSSVSLFKRENYSVIYYDMRIPFTDVFSFSNYSSNLAVGLMCDYGSDDQEDIYNILKIEMNHVTYIKNQDGSRKKEKKVMPIENCLKKDFYNEFNESYEQLSLKDFYCIHYDDKEFFDSLTVQGIYSNEIFKYYEVTVSLKDEILNKLKDNETYYQEKIDRYLSDNECRLEYYYIDMAIQLNNFTYPNRRYLGGYFANLFPDEIRKTNLYFKVLEFSSDKNYFIDNIKKEYFLTYSHIEDYSGYRSSKRFKNKPYGYEQFAKLYIRASDYRSQVTKKYMKLTEFCANMISILTIVIIILRFIMEAVNNFNAYLSLIDHLFITKNSRYKNIKNINKIIGNKNLNKLNKSNDKSKDKINDKIIDNTSNCFINKSIPNLNLLNKKNTQNSSVENNNLINNYVKPQHKIEQMKENQFDQIYKDKLNLNCISIIGNLICPSSLAKRLNNGSAFFVRLKESLFLKLDVIHYIKNCILIQILSRANFTKDESILFHFLGEPPVIDYTKNTDYKSDKDLTNINTDYKQIINSIQIIQNKENLTEKQEFLLKQTIKKINKLAES